MRSRQLFLIMAIVFLIVFSLAIRVAGVNPNLPPQGGDSCIYMSLAETVFTKQPFYTSVNEYFHKFAWGPATHPDCNYMPFFPIIIALVYKIFGFNLFYSVYISILVGALAIIPAYMLGRTLFNEWTGLLAGLFMSINFVLYKGTTTGLSENVALFFSLWAIYFMVHAYLKSSLRYIVFSSLFIGLAYLTRAQELFTAMALTVAIFFTPHPTKKKIQLSTIFILVFLFVSSPWLIRNLYYFKNPFFNYSGAIMFKKISQPYFTLPGEDAYNLGLVSYLRYNPFPEILKDKAVRLARFLLNLHNCSNHFLVFALYGILFNFRLRHRKMLVIYLVLFFSLGIINSTLNLRYLSLALTLISLLGIGQLLSMNANVYFGTFFLGYLFLVSLVPVLKDYKGIYQFGPFSYIPYNDRLLIPEVGKWLRENTERDAKILCRHPGAINFYSGRPTFVYPELNDAVSDPQKLKPISELVKRFGIDYIVDFSISGLQPEGFIEIHQFEKPFHPLGNKGAVDLVRVFKKYE